jgi:hypothetical protein
MSEKEEKFYKEGKETVVKVSKNAITLKEFLNKHGNQKRNLDKVILKWDEKTNKINALKSKDDWAKRIKEFFGESEKK